jgi:NAD(P) transhydrogenase subunit alpha
MENAGRKEVKSIGEPVCADSVACVVASTESNIPAGGLRKNVYQLPLSFIAPEGANDDERRHNRKKRLRQRVRSIPSAPNWPLAASHTIGGATLLIAVPRETCPGERRVALTPDGVRALVARGGEVVVEREAGYGAAFGNTMYERAGARLAPDQSSTLAGATVVMQVVGPSDSNPGLAHALPEGCVFVSLLSPQSNLETIKVLALRRITAFAMELVPRISRAQVMDVLSSMSTIAGYRAVLLAAASIPKFFPMMMTAAGSIAPARVLVIGAGVAGLQAIATARRLGAIVEAFDVRPAVKEQVESLGARYVDLGLSAEEAEDAGGYAKEVSTDTHVREMKVIAERVAKTDVVITTALIPGRPAPTLITEEMVQTMSRGSVIVDLAAINGGNCELTVPGQNVEKHGVTVMGPLDLPSTMSVHASSMFSKNATAFVMQFLVDGQLAIDFDDEIIRGSLVTHDGKVMHEPTRFAIERGA